MTSGRLGAEVPDRAPSMTGLPVTACFSRAFRREAGRYGNGGCFTKAMRDILDFRNFWFVAAQTPKDSDSFALSAGFGWKFCLRGFPVT